MSTIKIDTMSNWLFILSQVTAHRQGTKHPADWEILEGLKSDADNHVKSYGSEHWRNENGWKVSQLFQTPKSKTSQCKLFKICSQKLASRVYFFIMLSVSDNLPSYLKCQIINVPVSLKRSLWVPWVITRKVGEPLTYIVI